MSKFKNGRNEDIFLREYQSTGSPKAVVFYLHGLHEHSGTRGNLRYFMEMRQRGFHVFSHDHCGHGRSATTTYFGLVRHWSHLVDDALHLIKFIYNSTQWAHLQHLPFFLSGSSLGGMTSLHLGIRIRTEDNKLVSKFLGAALIAPAVWQTLEPTFLEVSVLKGLRFIGFGESSLGPPARRETFASDEVYQIFIQDPLCKADGMVLDTGFTLLQMSEETIKLVPSIDFPFAAFHGTADTAIPYWSSENLIKFSKTTAENKTLITYVNASHVLLMDDHSKTLIDDLAACAILVRLLIRNGDTILRFWNELKVEKIT